MEKEVFHEVNDVGPQILEHFVSQKSVVKRVMVALESSWADGVRLPHMLLTGGPGLGKTELSNIIAKEMGCTLKEQLAQNLKTPAMLRGFLLEAGDKDVLLIDEIHELSKTVQTTLYRAMENGKIFLMGDLTRKSHGIKLAKFHSLGATTNPEKLLSPFVSRFKLVLPFEYYQPDELELLSNNVLNN